MDRKAEADKKKAYEKLSEVFFHILVDEIVKYPTNLLEVFSHTLLRFLKESQPQEYLIPPADRWRTIYK